MSLKCMVFLVVVGGQFLNKSEGTAPVAVELMLLLTVHALPVCVTCGVLIRFEDDLISNVVKKRKVKQSAKCNIFRHFMLLLFLVTENCGLPELAYLIETDG